MDTVIETKRDSRIEKRSRSLINIILSDKVTQVRRYPFPSVLFESQKLQPRKFIAPRLDCSKSNAVDASKTRSTNRTNHHAKPTSFLLPSFLPSFFPLLSPSKPLFFAYPSRVYTYNVIFYPRRKSFYISYACVVLWRKGRKKGAWRGWLTEDEVEKGYVDGISLKKEEESEVSGISRMKFGSVVSRCIQIVFSLWNKFLPTFRLSFPAYSCSIFFRPKIEPF